MNPLLDFTMCIFVSCSLNQSIFHAYTSLYLYSSVFMTASFFNSPFFCIFESVTLYIILSKYIFV